MDEVSLLKRMYLKFTAIISAAAIVLSFVQNTEAGAEIQEINDYQAMVDEMIILVNEARAEAGLKPVYAVPTLNTAALQRAIECSETFSHIRPDSSRFYTVLDEWDVYYSAAAENIAAGSSTAEETFEQWRNSTNHWQTIINEKYTHMGVGICFDPDSEYGWYWEQFFIKTDAEIDGQYIPEKHTIMPACTGDIDGDGSITSLDLVLLLKLLGKEVILNDYQLESADCMKDGAHTIADAIVLRKYILGKYESLPVYP